MSPLLIDELRRQWPLPESPESPESPGGAGHVSIPLDGLRLLDACELPATDDQPRRRVVAVAGDDADRLVLAPLVEADGRWRSMISRSCGSQ